MATNSKWSANDKQKLFLKVLKEADGALTLSEVSEIVGQEIKSGSINTLITKGLVVTDGEREFACEVVYNGQVVGKVTKTGKIYKLVQKD